MAADDFTDTMIQDDDKLCPICFAELEEDVQLLPCTHKFHLDCLIEYAGAKDMQWADLPCAKCKTIPSEALSAETLFAEDGQP